MRHAAESGRHRAKPGRRRAERPGRRRAEVRPRYGRIAVLSASAAVTGIAVLGGFGVLPSPEDASAESGALTSASVAGERPERRPGVVDRQTQDGQERSAASRADTERVRSTAARSDPAESGGEEASALPVDSGTGRRIVFSESGQRVWLVADTGEVLRSYLVSGSALDNLDPGTYEVYSRSRYAVGIDNSGTMEYFVRFTQGDAGAAIGFHTIPVDDGAPVQTIAQLGTPLSHGCIRQRTDDAIALWDFAPLGTTVVVTA